MSGDRAVKKMFVEKQSGRREAVRQNLRRLDCIESHLILMGVKRWRGQSRRQICVGYRSEGGTGQTVVTVCQMEKKRIIIVSKG